MKVIFYTWSLDKGDAELIDRIENAFATLLKKSPLPKEDIKIKSEIIEIASYGEVLHESGIGIAFGSTRGINDPHGLVEELPALACLSGKKENKKWREGAFDSLQMITNLLVSEQAKGTKAKSETPQEKDCIYVETKEGHTVGQKDTNFIIDDSTATYLKKIKDLVGGHAYIEKNGIKIEIK